MNAIHAGSKRKARLLARDARRVAAVNARLQRIYELARLIKTQSELDFMLAAIPDEDVRAETRKLIEPFCLFHRLADTVDPHRLQVTLDGR